ncbi:Putative D-alanyl-D-alanine carboxypeptidase [Cladobotryum mycophilum]|uniref:D-alanyl-D-alanine carboxypeptidase n=1 Tax=Cladobotryum mycophilum TaxID=491253 RepID=A0ABR0SQM7_9HYPO
MKTSILLSQLQSVLQTFTIAPPCLASLSNDVLRFSAPEPVGMLSEPLNAMVANFTEKRNWTSHSFNQVVPIQPGGTTPTAHKGIISHPGSKYVYSDPNFMALMLVVEKVTAKHLDEVIYEYTCAMGMTNTFFNRGNVEGKKSAFRGRMATEEFQREPVCGTVHDENAYGLDGVSGHAGVFSTVLDTARFCQMILNNGIYGGHRILSKESVDLVFQLQSPLRCWFRARYRTRAESVLHGGANGKFACCKS